METKKSKIDDSQLSAILSVIKTNFEQTEFQNKDLASLVEGLTVRQIPSRLKRLADAGQIQDLGGSPKKYKLGDA